MHVRKLIEGIPRPVLPVVFIVFLILSFALSNRTMAVTATLLCVATVLLFFAQGHLSARKGSKALREVKNTLYTKLTAMFPSGVHAYKERASLRYVVFAVTHVPVLGLSYRVVITTVEDDYLLPYAHEIAVQVSYVVSKVSIVPKQTNRDRAFRSGDGDSFVLRDLEQEPPSTGRHPLFRVKADQGEADLGDLRMLSRLLDTLDASFIKLPVPATDN